MYAHMYVTIPYPCTVCTHEAYGIRTYSFSQSSWDFYSWVLDVRGLPGMPAA